uniref:hypothetical protein n=1 Tax=Cellvibrio fontiphilus TaxID=1815559 RepID=UPI002B4BD2D7|nr:hypothetical protein [Cellvibrio fontiphilus]
MTSQRAALSVLILLLLLTVAAYWWWSGRHPQPAPLPLIYPDGMMVDKALVDKSNELLQQADAILVAAPEAEEGNGDSQAANQVNTPAKAGSDLSPWKLTQAESGQSLPLPEGISIYEPVTLDTQAPLPQPGERLTLPLPDGDSIQVTVAKSTRLENGDYSWSGHLEGDSNEYPVVMTYGTGLAFATITTPKGAYSLEAREGSGWVYKNPAEVELTQPGKNDYLEVPEEELRQHSLHDHD